MHMLQDGHMNNQQSKCTSKMTWNVFQRAQNVRSSAANDYFKDIEEDKLRHAGEGTCLWL